MMMLCAVAERRDVGDDNDSMRELRMAGWGVEEGRDAVGR
jgi:hypothetical protein